MFSWFSQLPPGEQVALVGSAICWLLSMSFSAGMYVATIRSLTAKVKEHGERIDAHEEKLEDHSAAIATLRERTRRV